MAFHSIAINTPYDCSMMTRMEISITMILTHFSSTNYLLKEMVLKKFPTSQVLVLAYLDEERNLKRICIEIAGFTKLLSDGK